VVVVRVVVVGAGFSGIGTAVRLLQDGVEDLVVLEKTHDVGGVWRDNTYPGAACDVASHLYSFSFAPTGRWSRRFAEQAEIHDYLRRVARDFGVLPHVRFGAEVCTSRWDGGRWVLELSDGSTVTADVLVAACGQLSRPSVPAIPGLADFAGEQWHSARWRHDVDLTGRRVAVVGTGASAIQFVPEVVRVASHVTVFQRSAPYVIPKPDTAYGPRTKAALERWPLLLQADRLRTFVQNETRSLGFNTEPRLMAVLEARFRRHLERAVPDPALRARLTPTDPMGCKRILQSNDWYPALQQPHVDVVTERVDRVEPGGVRMADGVLHEADVLVLGTGFAATELLAPMEVVGRDGRRLADAWADGAEAHLGTTVAGFPNLALLYGPNTNLGHSSIVLQLESQLQLVRDLVRRVRAGQRVEVRADVQRRWNDRLQQRLKGTVFAGGCTSWYLDARGRNTQNWPGTTLEFRWRTRRLREEDYLLTRAEQVSENR
jgi:cation diffusion facilitator CzcD-associated flavoprotein CzcO